jgi:hypothetical protein
MTREQCIEAMAREMHDGPLGADDRYDDLLRDDWSVEWINEMATAAYDEMQGHIRAREEAVREMCAVYCESNMMSVNVRGSEDTYTPESFDGRYGSHPGMGYADAIRALDIGGQEDG